MEFNSKAIQRRNIKKVDISDMIYSKVPPQARELEEIVLGAILIEKRAFDIVSEVLKPEAFYVDANQRIFKAMCFLDSNQQPIDFYTVIEALKLSEELDIVGGPYYITKLTNNVVSSANIETHARIVLQKYIQRELIRLSGETIEAAYRDSTDCFDLLDQHEKTLAEITTGNIKSNFTDTVMAGNEIINRLYELQNNPGKLIGVDTGYPIVNRLTNGWRKTDLIILAARPSVGKTAFALNLARNAAKSGVPVGFFSLEMSKGQLMQRLQSAESGIYMEMFDRVMTNGDINKVILANERINKDKIYIDDTGGMDIYELRSKARRMVSKHNVGIIFIDYLQLMSGDPNKQQNREQEISKISRDIKALAKELKVPIIALSQLSRANETQKREPFLSDLRDSGAIEQDADVVMFLWRDDYQVIDSDNGEVSNTAYVKFAKHRNGALDKLAFKTDMRVQTWFDLNQWDGYTRPTKWKQVDDIDRTTQSSKPDEILYTQKGSKMSDTETDEPPF